MPDELIGRLGWKMIVSQRKHHPGPFLKPSARRPFGTIEGIQ
jgi:hypothetical protein